MVNKYLLAVAKFMPEMYLRQSWFTYSVCGSFTIYKERIQKLKKTGDSSYIDQKELDKACFQHSMAYGSCKDLPRGTYYLIKCLRLLKIQISMDMKEILLADLINFLMKCLILVVLLKVKL